MATHFDRCVFGLIEYNPTVSSPARCRRNVSSPAREEAAPPALVAGNNSAAPFRVRPHGLQRVGAAVDEQVMKLSGHFGRGV